MHSQAGAREREKPKGSQMKKILLLLMLAFSLFADNSDKRSLTTNAENIKRIDISQGVGNSAWQRQRYQDSNYSIRDRVLVEYLIIPKDNFLIFQFIHNHSTVDDKKAKELHTQAYYITHITVSSDKRVLLNASMSDLNIRYGGGIKLKLLNNQKEKYLTVRLTDSNNYTTEYYLDISRYTEYKADNPRILDQQKDNKIIDYHKQYPKAWEAIDIQSAVEVLYGEDMAKKVKERYRDVDQELFQCYNNNGVGVLIDTTNNEELSSLAIFSTTTNKKRTLVSIVDVPDLNVSVKKFAGFIQIPVQQDGETMVVGKDRNGMLHMSQLLRCKATNSADEPSSLIFKLN